MELPGSIYYYNNSYFYPTNCAFLIGSAPIAIGRPAYNPTNESYKIKALSAEEMPDVLNIIGSSYFTEDTNNINNGYPILKWQVEEQE